MSKRYMDWADWAGDNPEKADAELRAARAELAPMLACINGEHEDINNQGECINCDEEVEGWEPDDAQLDAHHGTSVAA